MRTACFPVASWLAVGVALAAPAPAAAGMPSVTLTDAASLRLQAISFFLTAFLVSAAAVRWVWNALRSDFPRLPRLSYPKAVGLVGLWGLLFLLVLTMVSGARELMTPGAWKKDGLTYVPADGPAPADTPPSAGPTEYERRARLLELYAALAAYALRHDGHYPPADDPAVPPDAWRTPHPSGMRYVYRGGTARDPGRVVACEPELFGDGRFVLFAGGEVRRMTSAEIAPLFATGGP